MSSVFAVVAIARYAADEKIWFSLVRSSRVDRLVALTMRAKVRNSEKR